MQIHKNEILKMKSFLYILQNQFIFIYNYTIHCIYLTLSNIQHTFMENKKVITLNIKFILDAQFIQYIYNGETQQEEKHYVDLLSFQMVNGNLVSLYMNLIERINKTLILNRTINKYIENKKVIFANQNGCFASEKFKVVYIRYQTYHVDNPTNQIFKIQVEWYLDILIPTNYVFTIEDIHSLIKNNFIESYKDNIDNDQLIPINYHYINDYCTLVELDQQKMITTPSADVILKDIKYTHYIHIIGEKPQDIYYSVM